MFPHPRIRFNITANRICPSVTVTVQFDHAIVTSFACDSIEPRTVEFDCSDDVQSRVLKIYLSGKKDSYDDNIIELLVAIDDFYVDFVELDQFLISWEHLKYQHFGNTSGPEVVENFCGHMGYDGTVSLEFTSPIYKWLRTNYRHYTK